MLAVTTVDEGAINHIDLQDEASLYMNSYGEDSISMAAGNLRISSIDLSLPGLIPFDLVRTYDSSRANEQIGAVENDGTYRNAASTRKEENLSALAGGGVGNSRSLLPLLQVCVSCIFPQ
ncbi:hypothetical protein GRF59_02525 [Paenibacillus sp. HJL G12]|uniref:DUF6531 domain-containing protein n=1 Tax=Paenibacillus dendrobii TaxID=2691084 RepID=A0A7X3IH97_9BACL|nr:DUF6531 domain-containing protein [Paenibacillus dendrobii]MWV42495.1 hypothetical protein [Paenibacillus dendrobii]